MSIAAKEQIDPTEPTIYAEDLAVGEIVDLGTYKMTDEDLHEFAMQWDPQRFHTDTEFAQQGHFGGIIASGIHSLAIFQRLAVLGAYRHWWVVAGRAMENIQFHAPVRPGMELHGQMEITDIQFKREDRALVTLQGTQVAPATDPVRFSGGNGSPAGWNRIPPPAAPGRGDAQAPARR